MSVAGRREIARRLFAAEFDRATVTLSPGEEERAPNYQLSPTGSLVNRLFVVGALTAVEWVNDETLRARVADPTGTFVIYASQYQQEARAALDELSPPAFVAVTGKANAFEPDGSDRTYTSIRPEAVATVDRATRDRWTVRTARLTFDRIGRMATVLADDVHDEHVARAIEEYAATLGYLAALFEAGVAALEVVAGDREVTESVTLDPAMAAEPSVPLERLATLGSGDEPASPAPTHDPGDAASTGTADDDGATQAVSDEPSADEPSRDVATDEGAPLDADASTEEDVTASGAAATAQPAVDPGTDEPTPDDPAEPAGSDLEEDPLGDATAAADPGKFDDEGLEVPENVLSDDERAEVEETYGTEFTTGASVDPPDEPADPVGDASDETASAGDDTPEAGGPPDGGDDELVDRIVDLMAELEDGAGVPQDELVAAATAEFDVTADAARVAIQDALMDGKCYEPTEDAYLPI